MGRGTLLWAASGGVLGLVALGLWLVPFDLGSVQVQQAAIAALVVATGWFAGFMLREISQQLDRQERLRDAHRALFAEIKHNVENLGSAEDLKSFGGSMLARIVEGDGFAPFIPRERNDTVFAALLPNIHILPRATIDPVVQYYSQLAAQDALADDMRGESFRTMSPQRRAALYRDYIGLKLRALDYGNEALETIDAYARAGARRAGAASERIRKARAERVKREREAEVRAAGGGAQG
ncbi:MAG: hypothetical protein JNK88_00310 [Mangrovicoccus sp.]|nr:hypothetical protein [Mangrovicoccus sp.]